MPYSFPNPTLLRFVIEIPFLYFSAMTLVFIFLTASSDPGYLSEDLKHAKTDEPMKALRVYNMKMFTRLKLYDFSQVQRVDEESSSML